MPSYQNNPFSTVPLLTSGAPGYAFGGFDTHNPGWTLEITSAVLSSDVVTYTATLLNGGSFVQPTPPAGALVSIIGGSPATFSITAQPIVTPSFTLSNGIYSGTFTVAVSAGNIGATAQGCLAIVTTPETSEAIAAGASLQWAVPSIVGTPQQGRSVTAIVSFPTVPTAATVGIARAHGANTVLPAATVEFGSPIHPGITPSSREGLTNDLAVSYAGALGQGQHHEITPTDEAGWAGDRDARMRLLGQVGERDPRMWQGDWVKMMANGVARANEEMAQPGRQQAIHDIGEEIARKGRASGDDIRQHLR